MSKPLIILSGPTAVGKTSTSILLAQKLNGEIISADSMQVYKGMDIGTAKITNEEMCGVRHHLIDIINPDDEFNVCIFKDLAKKAIEDIHSRNKLPIIVGGTGFYIQSVLYDIEFDNEEDDNTYRKELEAIADSNGADELYEMLRKVDPLSCEAIHKNNVKRVIRALEYYHNTGKPISEHNELQKQKKSPYDYRYFVLTNEREKLYANINLRVDIMIKQGLLNEVTSLKNKGYSKELVSMQGIGYKEIFNYLENNCSLEQAVEDIKQNTRHFAKRQLTWFKREKEVIMVNVNDFNSDTQTITEYLIEQSKGII